MQAPKSAAFCLEDQSRNPEANFAGNFYRQTHVFLNMFKADDKHESLHLLQNPIT